ncbi:MAG: ComF family protein [bacterium]|nr:ComF family protein [bacterium]
MESEQSNLGIIKKVGNFALDTFFPIECLGCGKDGEWICNGCAKKIPLSPQTSCFVCKRTNADGSTCFGCQKEFPVARLFRFFDYDEPIIKEGIRIAKYSFVKEIFKRLIDIAEPHLKAVMDGNDIDPRALLVIPIPLHPRRLRERGFNQAQVIGERVANICGGTFSTSLRRVRATLTQAGLDEADRANNIKHAFACQDSTALRDRYVVLVDDVATTGSTLAECAKTLRKAGVRQVWALTLAKG